MAEKSAQLNQLEETSPIDRKKRFAVNFKRFDDVERRMMQDLISSYRAGLDWNTSDLEKLPIPLRHALYHFSVAVCKNNQMKKNVYFLSSLSTGYNYFLNIFYFSRKLKRYSVS